MGVEELCLTWDDHHNTLIGVFEALLESSTLVDCTIAAEGQYLKAHKVVLSACSPYFEMLFTQENEKNPIVVLKDIRFQDLKALIDFIYRGRVQIPEDRLGDFTDAAESLQIKGLGGGQRRNNSEKKGGETPSSLKKDGRGSPVARKRLKNSYPVSGENSVKTGSQSPTFARKNRRCENTPQIQNTEFLQPVLSSSASDPVKVQEEPSEVRSLCNVAKSCVSTNVSDLEPMAEIFLAETMVEPKSEMCVDEETLISSEDAEENTTLEEVADYEESGNSDFSSTHGLLKQESSNSFLVDSVAEHSNTGAAEDQHCDKVTQRAEELILQMSAGSTSGDSNFSYQDADTILDVSSRCEETGMDEGLTWTSGSLARNSAAISIGAVPRRTASEQCNILDTSMAAHVPAGSQSGRKERVTCSECARTFASMFSLRVHKRIHTDKRPFSCGDCGKAYFSSGDLKVHRRIHTGEMPFHCQHCPMRFPNSSLFHTHMKKMHLGLPVGNAHRRPGRPPVYTSTPIPNDMEFREGVNL